MTKKEKFLKLVSSEETATLSRAKDRQQNRAFRALSQKIALAILDRLDALGWSQKRLAGTMSVSPQQVNKWVKGGENFTLETLMNLEKALGIKLTIDPIAISQSEEITIVFTTDYEYKRPDAVSKQRFISTRFKTVEFNYRECYATAN